MAAGKTCPDRRDRSHSSGFTLLEVLLATILSASLLAVLWGLFNIYVRLFETGQARTEQSQLARLLLQQLADDLHSAIQDSPGQDPTTGSPGSSGEATSVRRFGLLGSQHSLRFDVLQVVPLEETPTLDTDVSETPWGALTSQVPELRTVYYSFRDPDDQKDVAQGEWWDEDGEFRPGLTRRELDFETPYDEAELPGGPPLPGTPGSQTEDAAYGTAADLSDEALETFSQDDSTTWAPEVVGLEFRYFDGRSWSSQWDSLQRKSLPVAVEVAMQVRPYDEPDLNDALAAELNLSQLDPADEELFGSDTSTRREVTESQRPTYRLVIDLPMAKSHPAVRRPATRRAVVRRTVRPVVSRPLRTPGRLTVKRAATRPAAVPKSDQWIRTER